MNGYIPNVGLWLSSRNEIKGGIFLYFLHNFWIGSFLYMSEFYNLKKILMIATETVHSEGDQPWDFFGGNDAEAETPVLWPPHAKSWLIGKDSDAGRDWGQEEKGTTEDEVAACHHWLDGHESEWILGVCFRLGGLGCCDSWGRKESDMTERLNWAELIPTQSTRLSDTVLATLVFLSSVSLPSFSMFPVRAVQ